MIKTVLLSSLLVVGMGAGSSFAQSRIISVWGHDFTADTVQTQPSVFALAPAVPMAVQQIPMEGVTHHKHRHTTNQ